MRLFKTLAIVIVVVVLIMFISIKRGLGAPLENVNIKGDADDEQQRKWMDDIVGKGNTFDESTVEAYKLPASINQLPLPAYIMVNEGEELLLTYRGGDIMRLAFIVPMHEQAIFKGSAIGAGGEMIKGDYYFHYPELRKKAVLLKRKKIKASESSYGDVQMAVAPRPTGNDVVDTIRMMQSSYQGDIVQKTTWPRWTPNPIANTMMWMAMERGERGKYSDIYKIPTITGDPAIDYILFYPSGGGRR